MDDLNFELDMLDYDDYEDSEDLDITNFCLELEANEVIDDEQFDYIELKNEIKLFDNYWRTNEK
jgi:hypothetical protein